MNPVMAKLLPLLKAIAGMCVEGRAMPEDPVIYMDMAALIIQDCSHIIVDNLLQ